MVNVNLVCMSAGTASSLFKVVAKASVGIDCDAGQCLEHSKGVAKKKVKQSEKKREDACTLKKNLKRAAYCMLLKHARPKCIWLRVKNEGASLHTSTLLSSEIG